MGKNDFLTPKAIANRIKSKGLQKLRWYCQMCQKQCRDENGFKCHLTSESHRRQMELFGMNPERVVEGYSEEFQAAFMEHLSRCHPSARILARDVYNEFINDKHHVHMNATKWLSLTEFVAHLGREGLCKVEDTEKGWYITLIRRDPEKELADKERRKRERAEELEEARLLRQMEQQIERARKSARVEDGDGAAEGEVGASGSSELQRAEGEAPLKLALAAPRPLAKPAAAPRLPVANGFGGADDDRAARSAGAGGSGRGAPGDKPRSKVEELMQKDMAAKAAAAAREEAAAKAAGGGCWLHKGIVVKVMSRALRESGFYKKKAVVERVLDRRVGELQVIDDGSVLRVDQAELETVIPQPGGPVLVVGGPQRGRRGVLSSLDTSKFQAQVALEEGPLKGKKLWLEYEDVCKLRDKA